MNENYSKLVKNRSDAFLTYIARAADDEMMEEFARLEEKNQDLAIPKELDKKLRSAASEFQRTEDRRQAAKKLRSFTKAAAVILLALTLTLGVTISKADAFRLRLFHYLFSEKDKYSEINVSEYENNEPIRSLLPKSWTNTYYPDYLPEGFAFYKATGGDKKHKKKVIYFKDADEQIIVFSQGGLNDANSIMINNEEVIKQESEVKGYPAYYILCETGETTLIWNQSEHGFMLYSPLTIDELQKIADSLIRL